MLSKQMNMFCDIITTGTDITIPAGGHLYNHMKMNDDGLCLFLLSSFCSFSQQLIEGSEQY